MNNHAHDDETRRPGNPRDEAERARRFSLEDRFEDSLAQTWEPSDAAFDRRLRSLIGPVTPLQAPPYGFERAVLRARRRRSRAIIMGLAAGFAALAVASTALVVSTRANGSAVQTAGCDTVSREAPAAAGERAAGGGMNVAARGLGFGSVPVSAAQTGAYGQGGAQGIDAAGSGVGSGREVMNRKYEWAIGAVLTATALSVGIVAGCSSSSSDNGPSASATESAGPSASPTPAAVTMPTPVVSTPADSPSPVAAKTPQCHTIDLSPTVSIVTGSQGAGHELLNIKLTNTSGHSCTVYGYPGMKLEDSNGSGQATTVARDRGLAPKTLVVANGGSVATTARFDFDIPAADEPQSGPCEAPSVYMQITPPDETTQLSATIGGGPVTVCQHGALDVLPFIAGAKGPNQ